jgi:hypothetical protein
MLEQRKVDPMEWDEIGKLLHGKPMVQSSVDAVLKKK